MIEKYCKENIGQIKRLIQDMSDEEYSRPLEILSGSSIGQHVRHIAEFYICLIKGMHQQTVNYDRRERDLKLETDIKFAGYSLDKIRTNLPSEMEDFKMNMQGNFSNDQEYNLLISSSLYRELAYCLEHSIHHQALIKIGLIELNKTILVDENFGIAPATIRFKSKTLQD